MKPFVPPDPDYIARTRAAFALQAMMKSAQAEISSVEPGVVVIDFPFCEQFTQQHGYMHAGLVTAIVDSACGFAAFTLAPRGNTILTVEYKVNLLAPAAGQRFRATGKVVRAGKTLSVCEGDVVAIQDGSEKHILRMLATMMRVPL
ncbi:MAG TPA: PaaI family thioesterase [Candidatus Acidoferrales bacterium]|nr:PaaI family thioesterase [Candidatus Acidoferrales bacterium]